MLQGFWVLLLGLHLYWSYSGKTNYCVGYTADVSFFFIPAEKTHSARWERQIPLGPLTPMEIEKENGKRSEFFLCITAGIYIFFFMWKFSYLLLQSSHGFTRRSVPVTGWFHQILERVITVDVFGVVACSSGLIKVKARRAELGKRTKMQICDYFVFMEHEKGQSYNQSGTTVHADVVAATVARIRIVSVERRTSERPWAWGRLACCGLSRRLSRRLRSWLRSRLRSRICSRWCSRACGCHWLRSRLCGRLGSCAAGGGRIC